MYALPLLGSFCRESYSPPEAVYEKLKRRGMDLVTVTDHDSIDSSERLRHHADFFLSEEVTCRMPTGTELHVGVYDITERQHTEVQRRRNDLPRLVAFLHEERTFFSANHIFSSLTGRREQEDFAWMLVAFPALETLNGAIPAANNRRAARLAARTGKAVVGGSDAHTLLSLGSAYTEIAAAQNKIDFLRALRLGRGLAGGESGSYWKLTRDVLLIVASMFAECPGRLWLAPLALGIPVVTLLNRLRELNFVWKWRREPGAVEELAKALRRRRAPQRSQEATA